ncbi:non-hydrolyzing UDP-N-acetylglucosamine 2-epimerase [Thermodesulfobacteriota bacterium]
MKIMTILGTRPEIIRLSRIIPLLDQLCDHVLVHTGQNYDPNLYDIFFKELGVRKPDYILTCKSKSLMGQVASILLECEGVIVREKPDRLLLLGDTNSALSAIVAKRMGIPVFHMEAGNRCYDDRVPEEVNRRIIDHCSDVLMPYTERSRANLLREGIDGKRIFVIGNPINEVILNYQNEIENSEILTDLKVEKKKYFLVTMHRQENVDIQERLRDLTIAFNLLQKEFDLPIICSLHPRTRSKMEAFGLDLNQNKIHFSEPFGFFDFIKLERNAFCVLSDSGTVQEECCIFMVPNVTIRDVTERPETLECGSNILSGVDPDSILRCVKTVLLNMPNWSIPHEYMVSFASQAVLKILLGYRYNADN